MREERNEIIKSLKDKAMQLIDEIKADLNKLNQNVLRVKEIISILRIMGRAQPKPTPRSAEASPAQSDVNQSSLSSSTSSGTAQSTAQTQPTQSITQESPISQTPASSTMNSSNPTDQLLATLEQQDEIKRLIRKYNRKLTWQIPSPIGGTMRVLWFSVLGGAVFASTPLVFPAAVIAGGLALLNVFFNRRKWKTKFDDATRENNALLRKEGELWEQINDPEYKKERAGLAEVNKFYKAAIENEDRMLNARLKKNNLDRPSRGVKKAFNLVRGQPNYIRMP